MDQTASLVVSERPLLVALTGSNGHLC